MIGYWNPPGVPIHGGAHYWQGCNSWQLNYTDVCFKLLKVDSLCSNCRNIEFFPMKTMTPSRWREYFPFPQARPELHEFYEQNYKSFLRQVPDEYQYEAILHPDFESFADVCMSGACSFCQLLEQMLEDCYVGLPSEPGSKKYEGITVYPPPAEWPEDDLEDLRRSTPRIWMEISLPPFDTTKTSLHEALTDFFIEIKLANTLVYPRFLLSDVHTPGKLSRPFLKMPKALKPGGGDPNLDTGSKSSLKLAQKWLDTCRSKHKQCALQCKFDVGLPTRLLELEAKGLGNDLLLCETEERMSQVRKGTIINYVSLSHRWGEQQPIVTTTQNYRHRPIYQRIESSYLWIDSLCIIQDLDSDKENEIPKMADIYSNAMLNIAACSASDSSGGLFSSRDVNMLKPQHISFRITTAEGHTELIKEMCSPVLRKHAHGAEESTNVLNSRGWIYQERALSKRVFSFEKQLLYFECAEMIASESLLDGAPRMAHTEPLPNRDKWENLLPTVRNRELSEFGDRLFRALQAGKESGSPYNEHVDALYNSGIEDYLSRSFKFETDRLLGISGLASRIQAVTGDTYLAGLWRNRLLEGLCWAVTGRDKKSKRYNKHPHAPTWSWASMKGPTYIIYPQNNGFAPNAEIEILDAWRKPNGPNPFGDAPEGESRVKGRIKRAQAWSVATPSGGLEETFGVASLFDPDIDLKNNKQGLYTRGGVAHIYMDHLKFYTFQPFEVWVLPIASYGPVVHGKKMGKKICAMVLRKVGPDTFIREGWLWRLSRGDDDDWNSDDEDGEGSWFANGCEEMELKIV